MTFYTYMMKFKNEDSPRGDLARDIRGDSKNKFFKNKNFKAKGLMLTHLTESGACKECLDIFEECFEEFKECVRKQ